MARLSFPAAASSESFLAATATIPDSRPADRLPAHRSLPRHIRVDRGHSRQAYSWLQIRRGPKRNTLSWRSTFRLGVFTALNKFPGGHDAGKPFVIARHGWRPPGPKRSVHPAPEITKDQRERIAAPQASGCSEQKSGHLPLFAQKPVRPRRCTSGRKRLSRRIDAVVCTNKTSLESRSFGFGSAGKRASAGRRRHRGRPAAPASRSPRRPRARRSAAPPARPLWRAARASAVFAASAVR